MKTCEICGNLFEPKSTGQSRKYCFDCSPSYIKGGSRANTITALRRAMKREAVKRMGGACQRCGYNRCIDALTFHHTDPNEKEFGVGNGLIIGKKFKNVNCCVLIVMQKCMQIKKIFYKAL